ncbi:unnamed protein product [Effrenium voratum]|nr:unnamed protein product [Effrenium voratum]
MPGMPPMPPGLPFGLPPVPPGMPMVPPPPGVGGPGVPMNLLMGMPSMPGMSMPMPGMPSIPGLLPMGHLPPLLVVKPQTEKKKDPPRRKDVWPVFVGNISFDTTEEEVRELFGEIDGMVSWRLSVQKDGVSRGFGFAEFKTPEGALEAIKKVDGVEIKSRKLRLRWGENAPTTPEVDDFHRAPERFKTRPCYEVFKGMACPRGDCPYAHAQSEIRHPRDEEKEKPVDPRDLVVRVHIPIEKFQGDSEEAKQKAAYTGILGPGASNVRAIMKKASCRLLLRGLGAPGVEQEPLHLIVKPKVEGDLVTQEQTEIVRRAVDDILENGKLPDAIEIEKVKAKALPEPEKPIEKEKPRKRPEKKRSPSRSRSRSRRRQPRRRKRSEPRETREEREAAWNRPPAWEAPPGHHPGHPPPHWGYPPSPYPPPLRPPAGWMGAG